MGAIRTGLEVLLRDGPAAAGLGPRARIGLLAHAASVDAEGRHAVERLRDAGGFRLVRLFAPEHGLWGHEQDMERVEVARDPSSGLPVISLYGSDEASLRPRPEQLEGLDALVVDLQDVGSRYYTFVYTMAYVMEAAGALGVPVVVLDRPNPLGGERLEGPPVRPGWTSFVGRYPLPVCHGMTIGELAALFRGEFGARCDLRVVPMDGWGRARAFADCGLPWIAPSPNMPTTDTARVYPGGCLVEGTNLSEGRGTTLPFELVGAPWIEPQALAAALREARLEGVAFRAASFRPMFQKHAGNPCGGVQVLVRDPVRFRPFRTYLVLLREAARLDPGRFRWRTEPYEFVSDRLAIDLLAGGPEVRAALEAGERVERLERAWDPELAAFAKLREPYLLYR